jgi:hypothetical protein
MANWRAGEDIANRVWLSGWGRVSVLAAAWAVCNISLAQQPALAGSSAESIRQTTAAPADYQEAVDAPLVRDYFDVRAVGETPPWAQDEALLAGQEAAADQPPGPTDDSAMPLRPLVPILCFAAGCLCSLALAGAVLPSMVRRHSTQCVRDYARWQTNSRIIVVHPPAMYFRGRRLENHHWMPIESRAAPDPSRDDLSSPSSATVPERRIILPAGAGGAEAQRSCSHDRAMLEQVFEQNLQLRDRILNP